MMDIPGPCKHSVTKDHLLQIRHLISNQLQKGCSITYAFIERRNLSDVCYVKAALPHVLELLQVQFQYARGSDSALMVLSLQRLILNIYSQHCVPDLNEELEEDPVAFERQYVSSPVRALRRVEEVLSLYLQLITQTHTPLDWNCEKEYSSQTPGVPTHRPSSTEQAAGLLGQDPQRAPSEKAYRLGLIILAVCGALFLIIIVLCFLERKA
ncbi:macrophage colony-stimulating factor 1b [Chanos chanos]|uniref:Macrophage colony-stimulating factor 1b n=1 Tax=Chanos chanos TaxID=29144 RepID=A0A6J2W6Q6_CHACN|nr:uncharacterized protein LOC115821434 [Chanos chanos]